MYHIVSHRNIMTRPSAVVTQNAVLTATMSATVRMGVPRRPTICDDTAVARLPTSVKARLTVPFSVTWMTLTQISITCRCSTFHTKRPCYPAMLCIACTMPPAARCPSIRPSACIVSKQLNSIKLFSPSGRPNHAIVDFPYQKLWQYSDWDPLTGASNAGHEKSPSLGNDILKIGPKLPWNANRKPYPNSRMVPF